MKASVQNVREFGGTAGDCLLLLHDGSDLFLDLRNEDLRERCLRSVDQTEELCQDSSVHGERIVISVSAQHPLKNS